MTRKWCQRCVGHKLSCLGCVGVGLVASTTGVSVGVANVWLSTRSSTRVVWSSTEWTVRTLAAICASTWTGCCHSLWMSMARCSILTGCVVSLHGRFLGSFVSAPYVRARHRAPICPSAEKGHCIVFALMRATLLSGGS